MKKKTTSTITDGMITLSSLISDLNNTISELEELESTLLEGLKKSLHDNFIAKGGCTKCYGRGWTPLSYLNLRFHHPHTKDSSHVTREASWNVY